MKLIMGGTDLDINWFESIVYSFVSGLADFLPVSSQAHQAIMLNLFGSTAGTALLDFFIHIACLAAVYINCQSSIASINRTGRLLAIPARRRKRQPERNLVAEFRFLRGASIPALFMILLSGFTDIAPNRLNIVAICLLLNGIVLYITGHIPVGNKQSSSLNGIESFLIGIASGFGVFSGISRMGMGMSVGVMRGSSLQNALRLGLLLSIPVLAGLCVSDVVFMFINGLGSIGFLDILQCLISSAFAYGGATLAIAGLRYITERADISWFSYYCWGLALFSFLLFMI